MTYKQRVEWRATIIKTKGDKCPTCNQPCKVSFCSELGPYSDRFLEVCPQCNYRTYFKIEYRPLPSDFKIEIVDNKNEI